MQLPAPDHPNDLTWQVLAIIGVLVGLVSGAMQIIGARSRRRSASAVEVPIDPAILQTSPGLHDQLRALWKRQDDLKEKVHALELHISDKYVTHDDLREVKAMLSETIKSVNALRNDFTRVFARALAKSDTE